MNNLYDFSFVMPVYNAEKYLDETVESLLNQTINFKERIQLIFVNDGSIDNSEKICLSYKKRFPDNIVYIKQENQGVSSARNRGLDEVRGKYISFLDSDDKLSSDASEKVYSFFEANQEDIDLVAIRMQLFGAKQGEHTLNHRFDRDRVIDIKDEFSAIQSAGGPTFVKSSTVAKNRFRTGMKIAEDILFITDIILKKKKYGVVADPVYYYRKHEAGESATAGLYSKKFWYTDTPREFHDHVIKLSKDPRYKDVKKYLQYLVMYEMQWRFTQPENLILSDKELAVYKEKLHKITSEIDDDVILAQADLHIESKLLLLSKKHNTDVRNIFADKEGKVFFNKHEIYNYRQSGTAYLDIFKIVGNKLTIKGTVAAILFGNVRFGFKVGGTFYEATKANRPNAQKKFLGEVIFDRNSFTITVPIKHGENIQPIFYLDNGFIKNLPIKFGFHARLTNRYTGYNYIAVKDFLICSVQPSKLVVIKRDLISRTVKELKLQARMAAGIVKGGGYKVVVPSLFYRAVYFLVRMFVKKHIWLFSDRTDMAGDNGEQLFKYVVQQRNRGILPIFAVSKQSPDYDRLKKDYKVIDRYGLLYKVIFLLSDKVVSSQAGDVVLNPFGAHYSRVSNLISFDFIFLSHGINKDDISRLYNKYSTNASLYTTVTQKEYDSMFMYDYCFDRDEVVLTGFARYDKYEEVQSPKDKVLITPTWRKSVAGEGKMDSSDRYYRDDFKKSEYFKFYQDLISNKSFHQFLRTNDLKCEFVLHPALTAQAKDFKGNKYVQIQAPPHDYKKYIEDAKVLITDYSGVAFDFAYLKKPMIYLQFDQETFYDSHTLKEGYSYKESGFGPVVENKKGLVRELEKIAKNNFALEYKYQERVDSFFRWTDRSNCMRIYQAIIGLDSSKYINGSVKRRLSREAKHKNDKPLKVYWWRYNYPSQLNFGDEITPYIIRSIFGSKVEYSEIKSADIAGAGSIIEMIQRGIGTHPINVWGSGFIQEGGKNELANIDFHAVRGPHSLSRVDTDKHPVVMGDPGLLVSKVFRKSKRKLYKVGIVAHYVDKEHPALNKVKDNANFLLIDPLQTPDKVALDITSCEYVVSSSLHGLIFSDSFNIPNNWMPLSGKLTGGEYKFNDYYLSTGRETKIVDPSILDDMNKVKEAIDIYEPVANLRLIQRDLITSFPNQKKKYKERRV